MAKEAEDAKKEKPTTKKGLKEEIKDPDADLSEEDLALKKNLELCVERALDPVPGVASVALETIRSVVEEPPHPSSYIFLFLYSNDNKMYICV